MDCCKYTGVGHKRDLRLAVYFSTTRWQHAGSHSFEGREPFSSSVVLLATQGSVGPGLPETGFLPEATGAIIERINNENE